MLLWFLVAVVGWVTFAHLSDEEVQQKVEEINSALAFQRSLRKRQALESLHKTLEDETSYQIFVPPKELADFNMSDGIASSFEGWDDVAFWVGSGDNLVHGEMKLVENTKKALSVISYWAEKQGFMRFEQPHLFLKLEDEPEEDLWVFLPSARELKRRENRIKLSKWFYLKRHQSRPLYTFLRRLSFVEGVSGNYKTGYSTSELNVRAPFDETYDSLIQLRRRYTYPAAFYILTTATSTNYCVIDGLDSDRKNLLLKFFLKWAEDSILEWECHAHRGGTSIFRVEQDPFEVSWLYFPQSNGMVAGSLAAAADHFKLICMAKEAWQLSRKKTFQVDFDNTNQWLLAVKEVAASFPGEEKTEKFDILSSMEIGKLRAHRWGGTPFPCNRQRRGDLGRGFFGQLSLLARDTKARIFELFDSRGSYIDPDKESIYEACLRVKIKMPTFVGLFAQHNESWRIHTINLYKADRKTLWSLLLAWGCVNNGLFILDREGVFILFSEGGHEHSLLFLSY